MKWILFAVFLLNFTSEVRAEEFRSKKLAGWSVKAGPNVNQENLNTLESTLKELNQIFPQKRLKVIQQVSIQIDGKDDDPKSGKIETGRYEFASVNQDGLEKRAGVGKVHIFSSRDCGNKILLVHELSHAAQNLTIGFDDERVQKAYREIATKNLYPKDCYLMTNHREYFAEMSVVYLAKLHYFPHDRETLKKHDPISHKLMEDFWDGKMQKQ